MEKIAIITDSSADIDQEKIKKHNIHYINFRIIYSDKEYEDKAGISPDEVYRSLSTEIPTTSLPSIEKIEVTRRGKVRRAKINYLRDRVGKAARIKERRS